MTLEEGLSFLDTSFSEDYFSDIDEDCIKDIQAKVKKDISKICRKNRSSFKTQAPTLKKTKSKVKPSNSPQTPDFPMESRESSQMLEEKISADESPHLSPSQLQAQTETNSLQT